MRSKEDREYLLKKGTRGGIAELIALDDSILKVVFRNSDDQPERDYRHLEISVELPVDADNIVISRKPASTDPFTGVPNGVYQEQYLLSFQRGGHGFSLALPVRTNMRIEEENANVYLNSLRTHPEDQEPAWFYWQKIAKASGREELT